MRICLPLLLLISSNLLYAQPKYSVVTQHNDLYRTGWNNHEFTLTPTSVGSDKFGLKGTLAVDDQVYAQPLVLQDLHIGAFSGSVLFVATVNNTVYAFNADDVAEPAPLWQVNLNPAGQRSPDIFDLKDATEGSPCGGNYRDFSGRFGIVGTPVIDSTSNTLYVATKTIDASGNFYAYLNALDILTGTHKLGSPHLIDAEVTGNGAGSNNGKVKFLAKYQNQRPALLLYQQTVYVASASYCDWGPYHGWVLGFDPGSLNLKYAYNATPNGWAGGIWMAGQGISVGDDGNLYVVTGNGTTNPDNSNGSDGRSESLIKLNPQLQVLDWFTPGNYQYLDEKDLDYGSDGVLLVPNTSLTISGSKEGISYVVDYTKMGRFTTNNNLVNDTLEFNPGREGYVHVHGSPIYSAFDNGEFVYAWAETYKIRQFSFNRNAGVFSKTFREGQRNLDNGMPGAMLSVSSQANQSASAIVWACFPTSGNANNQVRPGTIAAYRAADVSQGEIWSSESNKKDDVGDFAKFNTPTVANGKVYVPTFSNAIKVYGLACSGAINNLPVGDGNGLKGEYFANGDPVDPYQGNPATSRLDKSINFNWGASHPDPLINGDNFKVRWTGKLRGYTDDNYSIYLIANDGVRLWINDYLVIDSWADQPITTHTITVNLSKSLESTIRLEYYKKSNQASCILQWSAPGICRENIPYSQLTAITADCNSNGTGLTAEYFSNTQPGGVFPATPTITRVEPVINFNWRAGAPEGISNDLFKARFSGFVQALDSGTYTFYVTADDGLRLWVDGKLLINKWIDQGSTEYEATITLAQCRKVPILLEFYENGGDAVCRLEWKSPVSPKQPIPSKQLYPQPVKYAQEPFLLYPNPAHQQLSVLLSTGLKEGDQFLIYNMLGQQVGKKVIGAALQGNTVNIPIEHLATGVYAIKLISGKNTHTVKFIKQ